jgi:hypothetical protein
VFATVTVKVAVPPSKYVPDPAVFVMPRVPGGGVQVVEALAMTDCTPDATAVATFVRVVQALKLVVGTFALTVTDAESPTLRSKGTQVRLLAVKR